MSGRYVVEAWVAPGVQVAEGETKTFEDLVTYGHAIHEKYPDATLAFGNADTADLDFDGLTEDERERLSDEGLR